MKKEYNIKDKVWIHLGEIKLTEGRVVEIIDLEHLEEGHSPDRELYIIEIKTGIDDIYEVRDFDQISPDAKGPINAFRKHKAESLKAKRFLNKIGVKLPVDHPDPLVEIANDINNSLIAEDDDPTPEEINAAIDRAEREKNASFRSTIAKAPKKAPTKKRFYNKKKKVGSTPSV